MKSAQIAQGGLYENKDGSEVRHVEKVEREKVFFWTLLPRPRFGQPRYPKEISRREFAEWAARPAGKKKDPRIHSLRVQEVRSERGIKS